MKSPRSASVELLRFLMMLGIVHVHVTLDLPIRYVHSWYHALFVPCVVGFVFISGYYSIRFRLSKLFGLVVTEGICVAVKMWCEHLAFDLPCSVSYWYSSWQSYWFLNAYVVLMCFAPIINFAIEKSDNVVAVFLPVMLLVYGWCFGNDVRFVQDFMPKASGVSSYSFLTLLGIYIVASLLRKYDVERWLKTRHLLVGALVAAACVIVAHGFEGYASPFALVLAGCVFFLFKRIAIQGKWAKVILFLSVSSFPIYIMHVRFHATEMRAVLSNMIDKVLPFCFNCDYLAIATLSVGCFGAALLMDIPRRLGISGFSVFLSKCNSAFDGAYDAMVGVFKKLLISKDSK